MTEKKDIFTSDADALVNPVNCVGVMGKGLAKEFKKRYPRNFEFYKSVCDAKELRPKEILIFSNEYAFFEPNYPRYIINFPTKNHWKDKSHLDDIYEGLNFMAKRIHFINLSPQVFTPIKKIAIPALGCGEGGLDWTDVKPLIIEHLEPLKIELDLYEPW